MVAPITPRKRRSVYLSSVFSSPEVSTWFQPKIAGARPAAFGDLTHCANPARSR